MVSTRDKIVSSGQDLTDRADHTGDMFDAVYDLIFITQENNVAVLAHDFNGKCLFAKIAHFVQMLNVELDDAFKTRLCNICDPAILQMLTKQHAEARGCHGSLFITACQINERKGSFC